MTTRRKIDIKLFTVQESGKVWLNTPRGFECIDCHYVQSIQRDNKDFYMEEYHGEGCKYAN